MSKNIYKYVTLDSKVLNSLKRGLILFTPITDFGDFYEGRSITKSCTSSTPSDWDSFTRGENCLMYPNCPPLLSLEPPIKGSSCTLDYCGSFATRLITESTKVASFSKDMPNLPLFASYGHHSISLEYTFDPSVLENASFLLGDYIFKEVSYGSDIEKVVHKHFNYLVSKGILWSELESAKEASDLLLDIFSYKHETFLYEQELRFLRFGGLYPGVVGKELVSAERLGLNLTSIVLSRHLSSMLLNAFPYSLKPKFDAVHLPSKISFSSLEVLDLLETLFKFAISKGVPIKYIPSTLEGNPTIFDIQDCTPMVRGILEYLS